MGSAAMDALKYSNYIYIYMSGLYGSIASAHTKSVYLTAFNQLPPHSGPENKKKSGQKTREIK